MSQLTKTFNDESAFDRPDPMTDSEYAVAFERMFADYFKNRMAASRPYLLYVTGLPGAGKSTFAKKTGAHSMVVNFDDLRVYHPRYAEQVAKDPVNAAARVDVAVEKLIGGLCAEAAKRKISLILDDAAMGGEITKAVLSPFIVQGYVIDAVIVAVSAEEARKSVLERFEKDLAAAKAGAPVIPRWVNIAEQENAPNMLLDTVKTLEAENLASRISVISRSGLRHKGKASEAVEKIMFPPPSSAAAKICP